jgi:hypothetical protein
MNFGEFVLIPVKFSHSNIGQILALFSSTKYLFNSEHLLVVFFFLKPPAASLVTCHTQ